MSLSKEIVMNTDNLVVAVSYAHDSDEFNKKVVAFVSCLREKHGYDAIMDEYLKQKVILSILVDTFISKISFPMQPGPEIGSISDA